jgi:hypothetical protein
MALSSFHVVSNCQAFLPNVFPGLTTESGQNRDFALKTNTERKMDAGFSNTLHWLSPPPLDLWLGLQRGTQNIWKI